jgi:uncharacterized membrane protein YfcA
VTLLIIALVAAGASALTFFSGFGLGTLLLPAFAFFYPIDVAIASTAVVHFLNGVFKLALVGRHASRRVVLRFGLPAIAAAYLGARLLTGLAEDTTKVIIGVLLIVFTLLELSPRLSKISVPPRWLPLGGALSGFFGGLSGMQGALRSAFLIRAGLSKEAFIGTGVMIACFIDVARLAEYVPNIMAARAGLDYSMLATAVLAAFAGAVLGNRYLKKMTLERVQRLVAVMLLLVAIGLIAGVL